MSGTHLCRRRLTPSLLIATLFAPVVAGLPPRRAGFGAGVPLKLRDRLVRPLVEGQRRTSSRRQARRVGGGHQDVKCQDAFVEVALV